MLWKRARWPSGRKVGQERVDWRAANTHYARAARLQPSNWQYAQHAGAMASRMGEYLLPSLSTKSH